MVLAAAPRFREQVGVNRNEGSSAAKRAQGARELGLTAEGEGGEEQELQHRGDHLGAGPVV